MTHGQNLCLKCWLWNKNKKKCEGEEGLMTNQIANLAYKDVIDKLNSM